MSVVGTFYKASPPGKSSTIFCAFQLLLLLAFVVAVTFAGRDCGKSYPCETTKDCQILTFCKSDGCCWNPWNLPPSVQ
ncbi:hypothetical protein QR680_018646 [Steinernema hermaphroditum]|uniref:P-type domain-containing protein n=1 Tax=Steinernema hermaphroditum TaxID=289476 RepID=A0AA39HKY1_9BILA|nr:hypothetical protein QR680_018646 [Steinernema hermaphroditum]